MVFKKIITEIAGVTDNFYKIKTDDPTKNQQIVKEFGLDFVQEWWSKINEMKAPLNISKIYFSIFIFYLKKELEHHFDKNKFIVRSISIKIYNYILQIHKFLYTKNNDLFTNYKYDLFGFNEIDDLKHDLEISIENKSGSFSTSQSLNKKEIKKQGYDRNDSGKKMRQYEDWELRTFNLMKKRPDIFPKFYNITSDSVNYEKVDIDRFKNDFSRYNQTLLAIDYGIKSISRYITLENINYDEIKYMFNTMTSKAKTENEKKAIAWGLKYIKYCITIRDFFVKNKIGNKLTLDLNTHNFGYRKGTHEIINYDPIMIHNSTVGKSINSYL